jgi:hypothetical protein
MLKGWLKLLRVGGNHGQKARARIANDDPPAYTAGRCGDAVGSDVQFGARFPFPRAAVPEPKLQAALADANRLFAIGD